MPAIGKQALHRFGTEPKAKGNDKKSEVENPAPSRIKDPVEGDRQEEECEEMQNFVIDLRDLDGGTET